MLLRKAVVSRLVSAFSCSHSLSALRFTASQVSSETSSTTLSSSLVDSSVVDTPRHSLRLDSQSSAQELVQNLRHEEKQLLLSALHQCDSLSPIGTGKDEVEAIFNQVDIQSPRGLLDREEFTKALRMSRMREIQEKARKSRIPVPGGKLFTLAVATGIPFIGFGFLDNCIMIVAGESIEQAFGITLGLSIMAAAALGNMISDVAGVCVAENIESAVRNLMGLKQPKLSKFQLNATPVRVAKTLGAVIGVCIGCLMGMAPLLWFNRSTTTPPPLQD